VELIADGPVAVQGDRSALAVLVRNLVDNAVRYSPPGARVEVRLEREAGRPVLHVDDAGPGIAPEERERVFDRFYRRAREDEPGTGLGLAIVRSVAAAHQAGVELGESPLGGLRATVRFPVVNMPQRADGRERSEGR
jgi:two-component system OmpR family sensor kinase/two-component system sensor histidine kinase QseC